MAAARPERDAPEGSVDHGSAENGGAAETVSISNVKQEVHLAPSALSIVSQLNDLIQREATTAKSAPPAATASVPSPALAGSSRTLTLQLQPGDLGAIDIRLHLTGDRLSLQLTVGKSSTLAAVASESDQLVGALGQSGYAVDSLVIRQANTPLPAGQAPPPLSGESNATWSSSSSSGQDQHHGSSGSSSHQPASDEGRRRESERGAKPAPRREALRRIGNYL